MLKGRSVCAEGDHDTTLAIEPQVEFQSSRSWDALSKRASVKPQPAYRVLSFELQEHSLTAPAPRPALELFWSHVRRLQSTNQSHAQ